MELAPYLRLGQLQLLGQRCTLGHRQILASLEFRFERLDLGRGEGGARTLLAIVVRCNERNATWYVNL